MENSEIQKMRGRMIQAVIFDNDGVIVDSEPLHHLAEKQTMARYGVAITEDEFLKYVGIGTEQMFGDWIKKFQLTAADPTEMIERHQGTLMQLFIEQVQPTPNVVPFIQQLANKQYKLAVASSSQRALVEIGLRKYDLLNYFQVVVCADDVTNPKPDPELFLRAAEQLQVSPAGCLVIEDSAAGIQAAKAAGMYCVGYLNAHSGRQDLSAADIVVGDFGEIQLP